MKRAPRSWGPGFIALAAFLWATDALFRMPALDHFTPTAIVFIEHLLAVIAMTPFILYRHRAKTFDLTRSEWISAIWVGLLGSGVATLLFTTSFQTLNPSIAILLQKIQPILVIFLAVLFLKETITIEFIFWGALAIASATALGFSATSSDLPASSTSTMGVFYSLGAAFIWAVSTVAGKVLLKRHSAPLATFWRFVFGLLGLSVLVLLESSPWLPSLGATNVFLGLLYISLIPGLAAMLAYYAGLDRTPASTVTIIELLFPICAVLLNTLFLGTSLNITQTLSGALLLISVTLGTRGNLKPNPRSH